jgi:SAM-dependent methyltransferase
MTPTIRTVDDLLVLLDRHFTSERDRWTGADGSDWWDRFYADRNRPIPFFVSKPDESLVDHVRSGRIPAGRALDIGCGPGRNSLFLAANGFEVDAVDLSPTAIAWAVERAEEAGCDIRFRCGDAFTEGEPTRAYDLICDSGMFHHLPPHRRISYLALIDRALAPGGHLAMACFNEQGVDLVPDDEIYRRAWFDAGIGYTEESLRWIFQDLDVVELRRMRPEPDTSPVFGVDFLWAALFRRPSDVPPSHVKEA